MKTYLQNPRPARRRGSVLLVVVVLLLMLAIMGTSYLLTTRVDRITSTGDVASAQIDQLVDGTRDLAVSYIVNSLMAYTTTGYQYRPGGSTAYNNYDIPDYSVNGTGDTWLADRLPVAPSMFATPTPMPSTAASSSNQPYWGAMTEPMNATNGGMGVFESPTPPVGAPTGFTAPYTYTLNTIASREPVNGVGFSAPKVYGIMSGASTSMGGPYTVTAADADGDGIADAGLIRLPGSYSDGLTYYAGIRIIDNNSAMNVNTAWDDQYDYGIAAGVPGPPLPQMNYYPSYFPTGVGLSELMGNTVSGVATAIPPGTTQTGPSPANDMENLNIYRLVGISGHAMSPVVAANVIDDSDTSHSEAQYYSLSDFLYHQLSSRVSNPGFMDTTADRVRGFGDADGAALAYHFCLINPTAYSYNTASTALTTVEQVLNSCAFLNAPNYPSAANAAKHSVQYPQNYSTQWRSYPATGAPNWAYTWYNDNIQPLYATTAPPNLRPLLVTRNGVSNSAPASAPAAGTLTVPSAAMPPYGDRGRWQPGVSYSQDDCVTYTANTAPAIGSAPTLPGNIFSGVFFSRASNNTGNPPTGLGAEVIDTTGATKWARPSYWSSTTTYYQNDYVYLDPNNATGSNTSNDEYHFYRCLPPTISATAPSATLNNNWRIWVPPAAAVNVKANVNTASFPELFRAYANAMSAGAPSPGQTPFGSQVANPGSIVPLDPTQIYVGSQFTPPSGATPCAPTGPMHPQFMFRSPIRENRTTSNIAPVTGMIFDPYQVLQLRAAIAAVNTESMRSPNAVSISRQIPLVLTIDSVATPVNAVIYSNQPQPFITEVYAQTDITGGAGNGTNPSGYVAIEIYNATGTAIDMSNWQLAVVDAAKPTAGIGTTQTILPLPSSALGSLPPGGFMIFENYNFGATSATNSNIPSTTIQPAVYRPAYSGLPLNNQLTMPGVTDVYVPQLAAVLQQTVVTGAGTPERNEFMLFRPRNVATGALISGTQTDGTYSWNENNLNDLVPADSFDFTGINPGEAAPTPKAEDWHYVRSGQSWQYVYPGRYNGTPPTAGQGGHQQGTFTSGVWIPPAADPDITGGPPVGFGTVPTTSSYSQSIFTLPLTNTNWAGPNRPSMAGPNQFPFGGFARNGDIVEVPFIAAYQIRNAANPAVIYETNPVTMDASFAEDSDTTDDPTAIPPPPITNNAVEQIGRFCPGPRDIITYSSSTGNVAPSTAAISDTQLQNPSGSLFALNPAPSWAGWDVIVTSGAGVGQVYQIMGSVAGTGLTLTTSTPATAMGTCSYMIFRPYWWATHLLDYLTVQDPRDDYIPNIDPSIYPAAVLSSPYPAPVINSNSAIIGNTEAENTESVQGLVNINTAPLAVLEQLPLVVSSSGAIDTLHTPLLAQAIIDDRTANGPFKSIFDLNRVYDPTDPSTLPLSKRGFMNGWGTIPFMGTSVAYQGFMSFPVPSGLANQFDEYDLQVTRLSNLITTRSDTFTMYIVVEGWQNAGTPTAKLINTRRAAYIVDRNSVTPVSRTVRMVNVPNN